MEIKLITPFSEMETRDWPFPLHTFRRAAGVETQVNRCISLGHVQMRNPDKLPSAQLIAKVDNYVLPRLALQAERQGGVRRLYVASERGVA